MRQGNQFAAYNFREYARRRTQDAFREYRGEVEERKLQELMQKGLKELQMMKYRPSGRSNRSGRAQIDHDVFEGLPVRHWRRSPLTVGSSSKVDPTVNRNLQPELPMPKDAHLLSPMSRALLQAARAGTVNRPPPPPEDDKEGGEEDEDGVETERGFVAKKWGIVPRHLEGPEPEYLAKRRKGLASPYSSLMGPLGGSGPLTKTKVRKLDADGNSYVLEVLVPEGQKVEGEVVEEVPMTEAPAPGTVVEGVGIVNADGVVVAGSMQPTPPRRRPPPPKRKPKGPGRGRKKKVQFAPGAEGAEGALIGTDNVNATKAEGDASGVLGQDGIKQEDSAANETMNGDGDTEMVDDSNGEGDEGEEGEDDDREEGELSPSPVANTHGSPSPSKSPAKPIQLAPDASIAAMESVDLSTPSKPDLTQHDLRDISSSPDIPLASSREHELIEAIPSLNSNTAIGETLVREEMVIDPITRFEIDTHLEAIPPTIMQPAEPGEVISNVIVAETEGPGQGKIEFSQQEEVRFPDGEVDLFGSLERHLDGHGNGAS
ncbi:MAG: hypothetical protein M1812_005533 [Candelaria pacifica]|nr:MAG: hypothetical protein M1812_005533 [Candelaria pacifica]